MSLARCTGAGLLTTACLTPFLTAANAGTQEGARILLHTQAPAAKGVCMSETPTARGVPCSEFLTAASTGSAYHVYLVVAGADPDAGIGGLSCGIDYDPLPREGVDILGWTLCSGGLDFRNEGLYGLWPAAQGGTRITWDQSVNCQRTVVGEEGVHATAGFFYVYAYGADTLRVVKNENLESDPEVGVGDCEARFTPLSYEALGRVVFSGEGGEPGCNPCLEPCTDPPRPREAD